MKTSELTGAALDWAVFVASGMSYWTRSNADWSNDWTDWVLDSDERLKKFWFDGAASRAGHWREHEVWAPSTDWAQGGPIIEREKITVLALDKDWEAQSPCHPDAGVPPFTPRTAPRSWSQPCAATWRPSWATRSTCRRNSCDRLLRRPLHEP